MCALRLKQTWGFLNQASPLGGIRDPERDSKSPKGSELGYGFRPSHFPLGKSQWKCAFFFFFKSFFVSLDKCPATEVRLCSTWCFIPAVGSAWENCISRWWSSPWTDSAVRRASAKDLGCLEQFHLCCSVLGLSKRNQLRVNTRRLLFDRRLTA